MFKYFKVKKGKIIVHNKLKNISYPQIRIFSVFHTLSKTFLCSSFGDSFRFLFFRFLLKLLQYCSFILFHFGFSFSGFCQRCSSFGVLFCFVLFCFSFSFSAFLLKLLQLWSLVLFQFPFLRFFVQITPVLEFDFILFHFISVSLSQFFVKDAPALEFHFVSFRFGSSFSAFC